MGQKWGLWPFEGAEVGPHVARVEAYPHAKFHLDPFNRLATIHERSQTDRQDRADWTDNGLIA